MFDNAACYMNVSMIFLKLLVYNAVKYTRKKTHHKTSSLLPLIKNITVKEHMVLCLGINRIVMLRSVMQTFQDPPLCSRTVLVQ